MILNSEGKSLLTQKDEPKRVSNKKQMVSFKKVVTDNRFRMSLFTQQLFLFKDVRKNLFFLLFLRSSCCNDEKIDFKN